MASEKNNYTPAFKKEVAQKALDRSKQNLEPLSEEYDVPVSVILMWATELEKGGEEAFKAEDEDNEQDQHQKVEVTVSDEEFASSLNHGVMFDKLDYKRLTLWSILGIILVLIFVQSLFEMYQYNMQSVQQRVSASSGEYFKAIQLKKQARKQINTFGVVNLEEGTYKIPIDSVINTMAVDEE